MLRPCLQQVMEFAPQLRKDPGRLPPASPGGEVLVFAADDQGTPGGWIKRMMRTPTHIKKYEMTMPMAVLNDLKALPLSGLQIETGVMMLPVPIGKKNTRRQLPFLMLMVDSASQFILEAKLLSSEQGIDAMWALVPEHILSALLRHKVRPAELHVSSPWLHMLLEAPCQTIGIQLDHCRRLPALEDAQQEFMRAPFMFH